MDVPRIREYPKGRPMRRGDARSVKQQLARQIAAAMHEMAVTEGRIEVTEPLRDSDFVTFKVWPNVGGHPEYFVVKITHNP
jgi:hypothetical protein